HIKRRQRFWIRPRIYTGWIRSDFRRIGRGYQKQDQPPRKSPGKIHRFLKTKRHRVKPDALLSSVSNFNLMLNQLSSYDQEAVFFSTTPSIINTFDEGSVLVMTVMFLVCAPVLPDVSNTASISPLSPGATGSFG